MSTFAITYTYAADSAEARDAVRPDHRAFLAGLTDRGILLVSGPYEGDPAGALLIFAGDSEAEVRALTDQDPFVEQGLVAEVTAREWTTVSGRLAPHF